METSIPPAVALQLSRFGQAVSALEARVQALDSAAPPSTSAAAAPGAGSTAASGAAAGAAAAATGSPHLELAMQRMQLARLVHGLAQLLFRARGIDVQKEGGSLAKEMSRIEQLGKKVTKAESAEYLRTHKPSGSVDVAAANRFISHALPDLTDEQRRKLRQDTEAVKAALAQQQGTRGAKRGLGAREAGAKTEAGLGTGGSGTPDGRPKRARGAAGAKKTGGAVGVSAKEAAQQFLGQMQAEATEGVASEGDE